MTPGVGVRSGWDPQELMVWAGPSLVRFCWPVLRRELMHCSKRRARSPSARYFAEWIYGMSGVQ